MESILKEILQNQKDMALELQEVKHYAKRTAGKEDPTVDRDTAKRMLGGRKDGICSEARFKQLVKQGHILEAENSNTGKSVRYITESINKFLHGKR